jgi:Transposase DDE domain
VAGDASVDATASPWTCQAADGATFRLTGPNPTDRGKPGSKYHLLVDRHGVPLAVGLAAANTHDSLLLEPVVDAVPAVKGPRGRSGRPRKRPAKLHGDKGDDYRAAGGRSGGAGSPPGSPAVASSRVASWAGTGMWWSGRWRGWWAVGACRSATSAAATSCSGFLELACALICLNSLKRWQARTTPTRRRR